MRAAILVLTTILLALATLYLMPLAPVLTREAPQAGPFIGEWVQTSTSDFRSGEALAIEIGDGELHLAPSGEGYAAEGSLLSPVYRTPFGFNALGFRWVAQLPQGTTFVLEATVSADGSTWSEWMEVEEGDEDGYGALVLVNPSQYLRYRVTLTTSDPVLTPSLEELALIYIDSREGPTVEEAKAMSVPGEAEPGVPEPLVISRAAWGADESLVTLQPEYRTPEKFIIHHTATPDFSGDPAAAVRAVFYYHTVSQGWGDIGYHYLIDWKGNIYQGRAGDDGVVGDHALKYNYGSIGIALIGDFSKMDVNAEMEGALVNLIASLADRFNISPQGSSHFVDKDLPDILGHRDVNMTTCPGDRLYARLPEVRDKVWQRLLSFEPRLAINSPKGEEVVNKEVMVQVTSSSPSLDRLELYLDEEPVLVGLSPVEWAWQAGDYSEGKHLLRALAIGMGGKTSEATCAVYVDRTPPMGTLTINGGLQFTSEPTVTLRLEAQDEWSGVTEMQFNQDGGRTFTSWETFTTEKPWLLAGGEGVKVVGARLRDGVGNVSQPYTATVILDITPPGRWAKFSFSGNLATIRVSDALSGLDIHSAEYSTSPDGERWGEWYPAAMSEEPLMIIAPASLPWIRFRVKDLAGNEADSPVYETALPGGGLSPDLVVTSLSIEPLVPSNSEPLTLSVVVANSGKGSAVDRFWVQIYVDPQSEPSVSSVPPQEGNLAWQIEELGVGQAITLTAQLDQEDGPLFQDLVSPGEHRLYAYVDSYSPRGALGMVEEADEANNLFGPVSIRVGRSWGEGIPELLGQWLAGVKRWLVELAERIL